ncbi:MAG: rod shape-determining protein MreC [Ignavibacteriae bacterium]|nr:rod shape-determining protein MreC [Ignavibacteriota bacterium]
MLERIYHLVIFFKEYVVLSGLIVLSLIMLVLNDNTQVRRLRTMATVTLGVVQEQVSFIPSYFSLRSENDILRSQNIQLADEVSKLRDARLENIRLRNLLELKERATHTLISANVVSKSLTLSRNTLTLDMGEADGVRPQMPVVNEAGVVGIVVSTSENYSIVNLLLNTTFRVSAKVERSRVDGIVAWDGERLLLKNVVKTLDVVPGDVILTSEYSSTFPPNIRIGVVSEVSEELGTLFKTIVITPSIDAVRLEEVFIVVRLPDLERDSLEKETARKFSK